MQGWKNSPVISLDQEDEERGSQVQGYPGLLKETLSQKKTSGKKRGPDIFRPVIEYLPRMWKVLGSI